MRRRLARLVGLVAGYAALRLFERAWMALDELLVAGGQETAAAAGELDEQVLAA